MKCCLGISNFLEEISSLPHSVVFLYFFALMAEKGFLISSCYSSELCIQILYLSFSPLLFASLLFTAICKAPSDSHFETYYPSMYGKLQHSLALPLFWTGMKTDFFQSCDHHWVFQICWHIECSTLTASSFRFEIAQLDSITSTSFVCRDAS